MVWRNAVASVILNQEIEGIWKTRDHASDGTLGDAAHASRQSDHNPWVKDRNGVGVVRARDIDEDLDGQKANGKYDAAVLFNKLLTLARAGDRRFRNGGYIIYEGHIYSETGNFAKRVYTGPNSHSLHIHVSLSRDAAGYDSSAPWGIRPTAVKPPSGFKLGDRGAGVAFATDMMNIMAKAGMAINVNGVPSKVQIDVPKDAKARATFYYSNQVRERVREIQRFAKNMWILAGREGPAPVVDGILGKATLGYIQFWIPLALQKLGLAK